MMPVPNSNGFIRILSLDNALGSNYEWCIMNYNTNSMKWKKFTLLQLFIALVVLICLPQPVPAQEVPDPAVFLPLIFKQPNSSDATGPLIDSITTNLTDYSNNQVPRYKKFEVTFNLSTAAKDLQFPYDSNPPAGIEAGSGVTVNALFTPDNWQTVFTQPAFYYQNFEHEVKGGKDWIYPTDNFVWKVRFAPNQIGVWEYKLVAIDATGGSETPVDTFTVVSSQSGGFVQVSQTDPRYFEFDDGSYFPALGYNLSYRNVDWINPIQQNQDDFQMMSDNGIQLIRIWLSQWSIYGSTWSPWKSFNPAHQSQEPDARLRHDAAPPFNLTAADPPIAVPESEVFLWLSHDETMFSDGWQWDFTPCMVIGWESPSLPVKQNTDYRIRVRYKEQNLIGPKVSGSPFGFTIKSGGWLWGQNETQRCYYPGTGTVLAASYSSTANWHHYPDLKNSDWQILEGQFNSGASDFIDQLYLTIENATSGSIFVDYVWLEENLGNGQYGPNIVYKPWMAHHQYIDQRNSFAFDKVLDLANQYDIYFKLVVLEKQDYVLNMFEFDGSPSSYLPSQNPQDLFYGNGRETSGKTKVRWLQEAWWRYLQARWGYSPHIHSWELLNEGPPGDQRHWILADEFGKYMHCRVFEEPDDGDCGYDHPNDHLVTTSFWSGFPYDFWNNTSGDYPDIDYADQHLYASQSSDFDATQFSYDLSMLRGAYRLPDGTTNPSSVGKPVMRGETGWLPNNTDHFAENATRGIWLHNFIWAGLNPGGVIESYWVGAPIQSQIYKAGFHDHRPMFKAFHNFISNISLNNGHYQDAVAITSNDNLRAWGQKDTVNDCGHLWVQNKNHTWKNIIDGASISKESGTVAISGFQPNKTYKLEWWDTYQIDPVQQIIKTENVTTQSNGTLSIAINNLDTDVALRIVSQSGC